MPTVTFSQDQVAEINRLVDSILKYFSDLKVRNIVAEAVALLIYASVAEGVVKYPADTRDLRGRLVVHRGAGELTRLIAEVGALTDDEVRAQIAATTSGQSALTQKGARGA